MERLLRFLRLLRLLRFERFDHLTIWRTNESTGRLAPWALCPAPRVSTICKQRPPFFEIWDVRYETGQWWRSLNSQFEFRYPKFGPYAPCAMLSHIPHPISLNPQSAFRNPKSPRLRLATSPSDPFTLFVFFKSAISSIPSISQLSQQRPPITKEPTPGSLFARDCK
jgi:hypothetical protein